MWPASRSRSMISPRGTSVSSATGSRNLASTGTNPTARTTRRSVVTVIALPPRRPSAFFGRSSADGSVARMIDVNPPQLAVRRSVPQVVGISVASRRVGWCGVTLSCSETYVLLGQRNAERSNPLGQFVHFFGGERAHCNEIERVDETVAYAETACACDRVTQRHCPVVLDEQQGGRGVRRNLVDDIPRVLAREHADAFTAGFRAHDRTELGAFFSIDTQADECTDDAAELNCLITRHVAEMLYLDLALCIFEDGERIDHADGIVVMETL